MCVCAQVYDRFYIALFSLADSLRSHVILKIMLLNVHRNHKAYQGRGEGGRGRLCTYRYTATTRMIPALRWAAILKFINCEGQTLSQRHQTMSTDQNFWTERRAVTKSNRGPSRAYQPNTLPLGQTDSRFWKCTLYSFIARIFCTHRRSGVLTVLFGCYMTGTTWNCCHLGAGSVYANHAPVYSAS